MVKKRQGLTFRNKIFKLLAVVFLATFLLWQFSEQKSVSLSYLDVDKNEHHLTLPKRDKKRLQSLMEVLFIDDHFSYTVLGPKPLSWATYSVPFPLSNWSNFSNSLSKYNRKMYLGWRTWEKYQHLFPSTIFFSESPKCYPGSRSILIVNEKQFNLVVQNSRDDFEKVLHRSVENGYQLLKEAKDCTLMNDVLEGHQALLGIVLGYGKQNSWLFFEKSKKREIVGWVWDKAEYFQENEEAALYCSQVERNLILYSCPSFAGVPTSEESLELKGRYLQTKQKVLDYYRGKDFLEATLSLFAGYRPEG